MTVTDLMTRLGRTKLDNSIEEWQSSTIISEKIFIYQEIITYLDSIPSTQKEFEKYVERTNPEFIKTYQVFLKR